MGHELDDAAGDGERARRPRRDRLAGATVVRAAVAVVVDAVAADLGAGRDVAGADTAGPGGPEAALGTGSRLCPGPARADAGTARLRLSRSRLALAGRVGGARRRWPIHPAVRGVGRG